MTPRAVFPWCESPENPSASSSNLRSADTEPRFGRRELNTVLERDARPGVVCDQEVAVEIDVVEEARDVRAGRDPEPGLDHASQHDAEPESARGVRDPNGLADPSRLGQLDVDAVRAL